MSEIFIDKIIDKVKDNFGSADELYDVIKTGNNVVNHDVVVERLLLDESWVNAIDAALLSVENIIRNPKKSIHEEHLIVPIEKANKVGRQSIQHLSSHSENIRDIRNGEINPKKIMTSIVEEEIAIYENRFIVTLLNKLSHFVEDRYKVIKKIVEIKTFESLGLESSFRLGRSRANVKIILDIEDTPSTGGNPKNIVLITKIDSIKRRLVNIRKSNFFLSLKNAKPVYPPIMKTNILTKNVDYNNAYKLWIFMGGYSEEGFTIEVEQKQMPCDEEYCNDLAAIATMLTATTAVNHGIRREAFYNIDYRKLLDKRFKVVSKINYKPTFNSKSVKVGEEVVNQYYFDKMREQLGKAANLPTSNVIINEKNITLPFNNFYKAVTKISNELFKDVLQVPLKESKKKNITQFDRLQTELARQKEVVKRAQILSKLKADELQKTLNIESREVVKLEKIKYDMEFHAEKKLDKDIDEQIRRVVSRKIKKRDVKIATSAAVAKTGMLSEERARQHEVSKTRKILVSEKREIRERRLLEQLKRKYEGEGADNNRLFLATEVSTPVYNAYVADSALKNSTVEVHVIEK